MASDEHGCHSRRPLSLSAIDAALIAGYAVLGLAIGWWMQQDLNWDLLNYHFYNAHMLVDGRIARDVHAAGVQSYLNPVVDLPLYAAFHLGIAPPVFFLSLAAVHGLGPYFVHRLTMLVVPDLPAAAVMAAGSLAGVTAAFGAGFLSEIGNTMHDNTLAVLVLGALWWIVAHLGKPGTLPASVIVAAGVAAGAAAGLKLAAGLFCVGLCVGVVAVRGRVAERVRNTLVICVAIGIGVILTGGVWMWLMYEHFGSPLFPFMNAIFASPFAPPENFADIRFLPKNAMQSAFYPFYWMSLQNTVTEPLFRDGRMAAGMLGLAAFGLDAALCRLASRPSVESQPAQRLNFVIVFWLVSYLVWLKMFAIYRYIIPLEMLAGTIVIAVAARLASRWTASLSLAVPLCLLLIVSVRVPEWGRTPWSSSYFGVDRHALEKYAGATVVMWDFPQGYLPPLFPSTSTFVRIQTNWGMSGQDAMWQRAERTIKHAPEGALYLLDVEPGVLHEQQPAALARLGLARVPETCATYPSLAGGFRLCGLRRAAP